MVRFGNVLGSSGSVLDVWRRELADGGPITLTDDRMTRYLMTVGEAAGLVLQAATMASTGVGEIFVLDMGAPVRIVDLARRFLEAHGLILGSKDGDSDGVPLRLTGIRPGEKLEEILAHPGQTLEPTEHPAIATCAIAPHPRPRSGGRWINWFGWGGIGSPSLHGLVMDLAGLMDGGHFEPPPQQRFSLENAGIFGRSRRGSRPLMSRTLAQK